MKKIIPINTDRNGVCRCIKATCYKDGARNILIGFINPKLKHFAPTCVIEYEEESESDSSGDA